VGTNCLDCSLYDYIDASECGNQYEDHCPKATNLCNSIDKFQKDHCFQCNSSQTDASCDVCMPGYKQTPSGCGCVKCEEGDNCVFGEVQELHPLCAGCSSTLPSECLGCPRGYKGVAVNCVACGEHECCDKVGLIEPLSTNCANCSENGCTECLDGFFLDGSKCIDMNNASLQIDIIRIFYDFLCSEHGVGQMRQCCDSNPASQITFDNIPSCFGQITLDENGFVSEMNLTNLGLYAFPPHVISALLKLKKLILRDNTFPTLQDITFTKAPALTTLDLANTGITSLLYSRNDNQVAPNSAMKLNSPRDGEDPLINPFTHLDHLQSLDLSGNSLTHIDDGAFDYSSSLADLSLASNSLKRINTDSFGSLTSLESLDLGSNSLTSIPNGVWNSLTSLQDLSLNANSLSSLTPGNFQGLGNLKSLDLNSNNLETLDSEVFNSLNSLKSLDLAGNSLSNLPADVFQNVPSLTELDLSGNSLTSLPPELFDSQKSLTSLNMNNNGLTSIPDKILDKLSDINNLNLSSNCIDCNNPKLKTSEMCKSETQTQCSTEGGCSRNMLWKGCIKCADSKETSVCSSCAQDYVVFEGQCKQCTASECCPEGSVSPISTNCSKCTGNRTQCLACDNGYTLAGGKCTGKASAAASIVLSFFALVVLFLSAVVSL